MGDADDEELLAGAGDGDIEFAVDGVGAGGSVCLAGSGLYDELHLCGLGDGGAVDDDVALAALVALYGVNADAFGVVGYVEGGEVVAYECALSAEGGDDAYRACGLVGEIIGLVELDDGLYEGGTELGLVGVGLEALGSGRLSTGHEGGTARSHQALYGAMGIVDGVGQRLLLMGQRHGAESTFVEAEVGKMANLGVHASLAVEGGDAGGVLSCCEAAVKALEERLTAVGEAQRGEQWMGDEGLLLGLQGYGGELLVVADEDELAL